jgi:hypothetical protein
MGNTTSGELKLPSSDNQDVIATNKRLKKFLTDNPDLLINKSPDKISKITYDQLGKPIFNQDYYKQLCDKIKQIIEESFEISSNIFDHDDNYRNSVIVEQFHDFKIREIDIQLVDCKKKPVIPYKIETITSIKAVNKITDIFENICEVSMNNSDVIKKIFDCLPDEEDTKLRELRKRNNFYKQDEHDDLLSKDEVNAELVEWDYNYEDKPKEGGRRNKYKKRKTNKSKKSRKHIKNRSRRPVKSRRYKKSRK